MIMITRTACLVAALVLGLAAWIAAALVVVELADGRLNVGI